MKQIALIAALALTPLPALAQEDDAEIEEGFSLMEEGARLMFRGILNEMEPALNDFGDMAGELGPALEMLATEMGPAMLELFETLDSVRYYEAPEILPNGDIIIRRSEDAPPYEPPAPAPGEDGEVDL